MMKKPAKNLLICFLTGVSCVILSSCNQKPAEPEEIPQMLKPEEIMEAFSKLEKNTIRLSYLNIDTPMGTGQSKIGGKPDLPADFEWPYYKGKSYDGYTAERPLSFLAQINLKEAAAYDKDGLLPKTGILSFFYELDTQKWGFDLKDKGCARVFYFEEGTDLVQKEFPGDLAPDFCLPEFSVSLKQEISLPSYDDFCEKLERSNTSPPLSIEETDWDSYNKLRQDYGCPLDDDWDGYTKLLGYPDVIQSSMELECEEVTRGFYNGKEHEIPPKLQNEINEASKDWILLFQMGTVQDENFELMFGDSGQIYFWIKKQDLEAKNFDNTWLILQCY